MLPCPCLSEYKKARADIKKKSSDTIKLQKKVKKGTSTDLRLTHLGSFDSLRTWGIPSQGPGSEKMPHVELHQLSVLFPVSITQ